MPGKRVNKCSISLTLLAVLLQGCVYTPRVVETYTPECAEPRRHVEIEKEQVKQFLDCSNEGCLAYPIAAGFVSAGTYVASATFATVGNVAYWADHKIACN